MKTPLLFNVPKDRPSRKERIKAFKELHGIETHYAGRTWGKKNNPWDACLMPRARQIGSNYGCNETSTLGELVGSVCRLLEEAGVLVTGETECDAIRTLCENNKIPCDL